MLFISRIVILFTCNCKKPFEPFESFEFWHFTLIKIKQDQFKRTVQSESSTRLESLVDALVGDNHVYVWSDCTAVAGLGVWMLSPAKRFVCSESSDKNWTNTQHHDNCVDLHLLMKSMWCDQRSNRLSDELQWQKSAVLGGTESSCPLD